MNFHEQNQSISIHLENLKIISEIFSEHQKITLFEHEWLGKILVINDEIQHIENYQEFYHEQLVHLPISLIPKVEDVLIIGGGSLFAAYEILKYPTVKKLVLCDYDHMVLNLMKKHYAHANKVLNDPRFYYIEQDAHDFISNEQSKYDLIINDCFNLSMESQKHGVSYYKLLSDLTKNGGVCSDVIYRHIFDKKTNKDSLDLLKQEQGFKISLINIPEYPGIFHLQTIWGDKELRKDITIPKNQVQLDFMHNKKEISFNLYLPNFLEFYFFIPPYIKNLFNEI